MAISVAFGLSQKTRVETGFTLDRGENIRGDELIPPGCNKDYVPQQNDSGTQMDMGNAAKSGSTRVEKEDD